MRGGVLTSAFAHTYEDIISVENLLAAWTEFVQGKRKRADVQEFQSCLMSNIFALHHELKNETYRHGGYEHFVVIDPKRRDIHKASVRDRLLHHAIYRVLYPYYDTQFIHDSYSCRNNKGTHRAMNQFRRYARKASNNHTKTVWVLKCDIRKFFATIDQTILIKILERHIFDKRIINLLQSVVTSFSSTKAGKGLPLGNLTSQLLVNIYMNEFDKFMKHAIKATYYIRYADDFVVVQKDKYTLLKIVRYIVLFLGEKLQLELHPHKVSISTFASGVDFLGWVHFPNHRVLRTMTKKRMFLKLGQSEYKEDVVTSYEGLLKTGNGYLLEKKLYLLSDPKLLHNFVDML